jgi:hypothetical protein
MCQSPEKLLFLNHSEKCNRSLKKSATATENFYEKSATNMYFLGWLRNKNFSDACYLANPFLYNPIKGKWQ